LDLDGEALASRAFSASKPILMVADLGTESGKNDQTGFMMVMQSAFGGIRKSMKHHAARQEASDSLVHTLCTVK